ncbi:hypothetical protein DPEC_G00343400 [Dallia pectoralis]|uniref:Uncharacterized protein n=1 Tax=Dallia pectoralis TaxID=75939 RepID=A0ACC2F2Z2_DALPE|nr:hypothetical protein DPEC_G00343400 [Dallia pectoralis]
MAGEEGRSQRQQPIALWCFNVPDQQHAGLDVNNPCFLKHRADRYNKTDEASLTCTPRPSLVCQSIERLREIQ